jgi:ribonuclease E
LTVIDVNSGSFTRSANARETVLWTNCEAATEIARQLKLRNIGGVVIIDFIDMESRRDQLQLLEHFTQSVRDDSARPQIAQLTELGLVELTRKRQGQNIYELFGRVCPSCGGLGHVAVLPGKDTLQPLASLPGVVRTVPSSRPDATPAAAPTEAAGGRRRRGGRGGRGGDTADVALVPSPNGALSQGEAPEIARPDLEERSRRQELEFVAVPMDAAQEEVYGWMGFNPALLLDPLPSGENLVMRVVRPGCDPEVVLEEARQQASAAGSRRRRRGGRGGEGRAPAAGEVASGAAEADGDAEDRLPPVPLAIPADIVTVELPARRRFPGGTDALDAATASPEPPGSEPPDDGGDESNTDPRRRRRRSSATV